MSKSRVYFTDFRVPVGTSWIDKLKRLCIVAGIKNIDMDNITPREAYAQIEEFKKMLE